ncbi:iron-hydroxamate ABC transporter substrate-binding protein [Shimazuella kribbensis]|uniref:iron-hydroxamate ABC transporter substrate-binding protein n=1 Tax=Shimazuella kribbensis TaxID=139808 RepID=UPI0004163797|nr:iron-hydroxamate ABC transporter substrate-binding protein [Shimazuella kribbensis]
MNNKKRIWGYLLSAVLVVGILAGCSGATDSKESNTPKMVTYQSENGPVQVPANPKRIAVLASSYAGNLLQLGITPIAVVDWSVNNKFYNGKLDKVEIVTSDSLEKILALKPDLIITYSDDKSIKKYKEIAPTVVFTYDKYSYLEAHLAIGKLVGKEKEAQAWVNEWKKKTAEAKKKVKAVIGDTATASVFETYGKELYIYGNNWGRGTEIIYQALGIQAPKKVEKDVFGPGYKAISPEVIPQYAGDYLFVGKGDATADNSYLQTSVWKQIPAVQKGNVFFFDSASFYFNDPISLEKELDFIVSSLTKGK